MKEDNSFTKGIIHMQGLEFYAYHGVMLEENKLGQKFIVDLDIYPLKWPDNTDDIKEAVNYAEVYNTVKNCVEGEKYKLIETVAEVIADKLLNQFACEQVRVEVHKPNAPIPGVIGDVSVEIRRGIEK